MNQKSKQLYHHRDCYATQHDPAATTAAAEAVAKDGAPLSPSASLALTKKKRDEANKKANDREAYYDALGSDEDDEIMKEMMDLSNSGDEQDTPVTQKKRKHKN
jgi:hypothetical protein